MDSGIPGVTFITEYDEVSSGTLTGQPSTSWGNFRQDVEGPAYNEIAQAQSVLQGLVGGSIDPRKVSDEILNNIKNYFPDVLANVISSRTGTRLNVDMIQTLSPNDLRTFFIRFGVGDSNNNMWMYLMIGVVVVLLLVVLLRR